MWNIVQTTPEILKKGRARDALSFWNNEEYSELEKTYGKYLYVPLDIPKIELNDLEKFIHYYFNLAKPITKVKTDIAGIPVLEKKMFPVFLSIDSERNFNDPIWDSNVREEFVNMFPELLDQIYEYLPVDKTKKVDFSLWSSIRSVLSHRDHSLMVDLPLSWRVKLYDENPKETLFVTPNPPNSFEPRQFIKVPENTNSFTWNNLRVMHGSDFIPDHKKILMLVYAKHHIDTNKLIDLFDRSISKYREYVITDRFDIKDYIGQI